MEKTFILSCVTLVVGGLIALCFYLLKKIINNALAYVRDQMQELLLKVGEITDRLSKNMEELSKTIKENHKQQIDNQTDVASIKTDVRSHGKQIERLEDKVDKHISEHKR